MASYPGGKAGDGVYQRIISLMPPHRIYVEPFLGGGAIMRLKKPAIASVGVDADQEVADYWQWVHGVPDLDVFRANALDWLPTGVTALEDVHGGGPTLVYCDPPYMVGTRRKPRPIYRCEMTDEDHVRLLSILKALPCMVMVSGYWSALYGRELHDWRTVIFQAQTRGGSTANEFVWLNFPEPLELHDYRYLGEGFRERERIKRKTARWLRRLREMPTLERHAMMAAISQLRS